jgi:hypothetical protein
VSHGFDIQWYQELCLTANIATACLKLDIYENTPGFHCAQRTIVKRLMRHTVWVPLVGLHLVWLAERLKVGCQGMPLSNREHADVCCTCRRYHVAAGQCKCICIFQEPKRDMPWFGNAPLTPFQHCCMCHSLQGTITAAHHTLIYWRYVQVIHTARRRSTSTFHHTGFQGGVTYTRCNLLLRSAQAPPPPLARHHGLQVHAGPSFSRM